MAATDKPQALYAAAQPAKAKKMSLERSQQRWGWVFLSPWIIGFIAFTLIPMTASFIFTFTNLKLADPGATEFIGLDNYRKLFNDPDLKTSLWVTLRFAVVALPLSIVIPLSMATLLNAKNLWAKRLFRTLFYMPYMVPLISVIYIFNGFLNANTGWLNMFLDSAFGIKGPDWLFDPFWIYPALFIIGIWGTGNAMLTMLASMQTVPTELYEAARVDGADSLLIFRKITLPLISPVIFYNLVLSLIGLFRYFEIPYVIKRGTGDPGNATLFYNIHFFRTAFRFQDMGYGATLAWLIFLIAMIATVLVFASAKYWVFYAGDRD